MSNLSLKPIKTYLNIPTALCDQMLREKYFFRAFQIWLFLKCRCSGQIKITTELRRQMAISLGVNERTIRNQLKKLSERNWIGYSSKSGYTFVRGFKKVMELEDIKGRAAAWLNVETELNNFKGFKAYTISNSLGYLANNQKWKVMCHQKESERSTGSSNHNSNKKHVPSHFPISCLALSKIFGLANGTASNYKKLAGKSNYIDLQKNCKRIFAGEGELPFLEGLNHKEGVPAKFSVSYKKAFPEIAHKVRIRGGFLCLEELDLIQPLLEYKRRHSSFNRY